MTSFALSGAYPGSDVLGQTDYNSDSTGTTDSTMDRPWGSTAVDDVNHRLFVADTYNNRVLVYDLDSSNNIVSHAASYVLGQSDLFSHTSGYAANQLYDPTGLAYDAINNRLFVTSYYDVYVFDLAGGITDGMPASYELGQPTGFGGTSRTVDQATTDGTYNGIAYDSNNDTLFVMDLYRVLAFNANPSTISTGENASNILGQLSYTDTSTGDNQNSFDEFEYSGMAFDNTRNMLYVADSYNNRVLVFDLANGITDDMNASYVLGQTSFYTNSYGYTQDTMYDPYGLGIDTADDELFVDDSEDNSRVLVFDLANGITNGMNASAVLGQTDFNSDTRASNPTQTGMDVNYSENIAFDSTTGRLYMPEYDYSRVLVYDFVHITNPPSLPSGALGNAYNQTLSATGYEGNLTYSITGGSLPPGLSLDTTTGSITGTPTKAGTYTFEVSVTDAFGAVGSFTEDPSYTINIPSPTTVSSSPSAPDTGYGAKYQPSSLANGLSTLAIISLAAGIYLSAKSKKI